VRDSSLPFTTGDGAERFVQTTEDNNDWTKLAPP